MAANVTRPGSGIQGELMFRCTPIGGSILAVPDLSVTYAIFCLLIPRKEGCAEPLCPFPPTQVTRSRHLSRNPSIQGMWSIDTFAAQLEMQNTRAAGNRVKGGASPPQSTG